MTADPLTKAMYSRPLLGLMADGEVHFYNKDGHPIQARRLPVIDDFTEEQLEKGDTSWTGTYLSIKNIKQIQHHYTSSSRSTWSPASSTRMNLWLLTFLYLASTAGGMEDDDQCRAEDVSQLGRQAQALHLVSHGDGDFLPDLRFVLDEEDPEPAQKLHSDPNGR